MVLRPVRRDPARLETADLFRRLNVGTGAVADPERIDQFLEALRVPLGSVLRSPTVLSGLRAQALFASLVVALDGCQLMATMDAGEIFVDEPAKAPDFLVVLRDGRRLLVEVKSIPLLDPSDRLPMRAKELQQMQRFAELLDAELFIAVFMSQMAMWALVPAHLFTSPSDGPGLDLETAFKADHMVELGDAWIGTTPPISLELGGDPSRPAVLEHGRARFTIGDVQLFVGGTKLQTPQERSLAMFMLTYGGWPHRQDANVEDDVLNTVRLVAEPAEDAEGQGFQMVDRLSAMYSRMFLAATEDGEGGVTALDSPPRPGFLPDLLPRDFRSERLPIWRLNVHPS